MLTGFLFRVVKIFIVWILMGIGLMTLVIYFYYPNVDIHSIKPKQVIEKVKPVVAKINKKIQVEKVLKEAGKKINDIKNNLLSENTQLTKSDIEDDKKIVEDNIDNSKNNFYSSYKEREKKLFDRQLAIVTELTS
jgi:hypothetical protein